MSQVMTSVPKPTMSERVLGALGGFWPAWLEGATVDVLDAWAAEFARFRDDQVVRAIRAVATTSPSPSPRIVEVMAVIREETRVEPGLPACVEEAAEWRARCKAEDDEASAQLATLSPDQRLAFANEVVQRVGARTPVSEPDHTTWTRSLRRWAVECAREAGAL